MPEYLTANELKLAYVHIPKCGGRTFSSFLRQHFHRAGMCNSPHWDYENEKPFSYFDLIHGHFAFDEIPLPRCFRYITLLRHPVDRAISQYNHFMELPHSLKKTKIVKEENWSFLDFVSTANRSVSFWVHPSIAFLGGFKRGGDIDHTFEEVFKDAVYNLCWNFDFVGILEEWDRTIETVKTKYGVNAEVVNRGITPEDKKHIITEEDKKAAERYLEMDIALYELGVRLFHDQADMVERGDITCV